MKKVTITLLLLVALTGLLGCRTTRATLKTDTKQEVRQEQVTDSSRAQQTTTSDRINAALSSNEQQNVVIEFDEWEYYPAANDTTTGGNYAQNLADFIRDANGEADKPPNTGSVKKHRKGTITINSDRQTKETKEQEWASIDELLESTQTGDRKTRRAGEAAVKEELKRIRQQQKQDDIVDAQWVSADAGSPGSQDGGDTGNTDESEHLQD